MDPAIRKLTRELVKLLIVTRPLEEQAEQLCSRMLSLQQEFTENFDKLSSVTAQLQNAYSKIAKRFDMENLHKVSELYKELNNTFIDWSRVQKSSTDNWFKNIRMIFAFSSQEIQGMENVRPAPNSSSLKSGTASLRNTRRKRSSLRSRRSSFGRQGIWPSGRSTRKTLTSS